MTADENKQPDEQDETQLADLDVSDEASDDVRGGMTKQDFIAKVAPKSGLSNRDAQKAPGY